MAKLSDNLQILSDKKYAAEAYLRQRQNERDSERDLLLRAEEKRIDGLITAKYGAAIKQAIADAKQAGDDYRAALETEALSGAGCSVPVGSRMVKWDSDRWSRELTKGETGIVEAITGASVHPANAASHSMASIGEFVVRLLKRDGTPRAKYVKFGRHYGGGFDHSLPPYGWNLEGVDPNVRLKRVSRRNTKPD